MIVAPDSFKGTLTAQEAAEAMSAGIKDYDPSINAILLPVADGGEGTMRSLVSATNGKLVTCIVQDPLGRKIEACYGVLGDKETCVIEIAEASGLMLLEKNERNPLITSTYGTGELIRHALDAGYRKFIIGLGGSATNDAGTGMLRALGMKFLDRNGDELRQGGGSLADLAEIDSSQFDQRINESEFLIASDVQNPLIGPSGASAVFGPQKGATSEMVQKLDESLTNFANIVKGKTGISLHDEKGAGAAGGVGGALLAFFPSEIKDGIQVVLEAISFHQHLKDADLVITGEGKTDTQTLSGKAPYGIAKVAKEVEKPVILISGTVDENSKQNLRRIFTEIHAIADGTVSREQSIKHAAELLRRKTSHVINNYFSR